MTPFFAIQFDYIVSLSKINPEDIIFHKDFFPQEDVFVKLPKQAVAFGVLQ